MIRLERPKLVLLCAVLACFPACVSSEDELPLDAKAASPDSAALDDPLSDADEKGNGDGAQSEGNAVSATSPGKGGDDRAAALEAQRRSAIIAALPLPPTRTAFGLRRFLEDYVDAYRSYVPLAREYRAYFELMAALDDPQANDLDPLATRVAEDPARAHWAFVAGVNEALDFLAVRSRGMLHADKEKNALVRMRVLVFLAETLDSVSGGGEKYRAYARALYAEIMERHFGRKVKPRSVPQ
jgi:hypothetical protein